VLRQKDLSLTRLLACFNRSLQAGYSYL